MDSITVLGMDPSFSNWGYVRGSLNLKTMKLTIGEMWTTVTEKGKAKKQVRVSSDDMQRARTLNEALEKACKDIQIAFVEVPSGSQSASGMKGYAVCIGVLGSCPVPMVQLSENDCKMRTIGKKSATKRELISWAFAKHPEAPWDMRNGAPQANNEHMADAINAIYAGIQDDQFQGALAIIKYMNRKTG
jgi:hypothetical protein